METAELEIFETHVHRPNRHFTPAESLESLAYVIHHPVETIEQICALTYEVPDEEEEDDFDNLTD